VFCQCKLGVQAKKSGGARLRRKEILVIDDEENISRVIKIRLENEGYKVITTTDPLDGIRKAFLRMPDLILLDVMMPKLTGLEVLEILSQSGKLKNTAIIMLTAKREKQEVEKALKLGAVDYCAKPFEWNVLKGKIEKAIKVEEELERKEDKLLSINVKIESKIVTIYLDGILNTDNIGEVKEVINLQMREGNLKQIIELNNIKRTDLFTIHDLVNIIRDAKNIRFAIISQDKKINQLLKERNARQYCGLFDNEEDAINSF